MSLDKCGYSEFITYIYIVVNLFFRKYGAYQQNCSCSENFRLIYHIVINTYRREMTIPDETSEHMYRYIWSIINSRNCKLYRIGGIGNHIHMLVELSPSVALSDLVRDIKQGSSKWAKQQVYFPMFSGWGKEYGAFSCSVRDKEMVVNYINRQREHHKEKTFEQEYKEMIERSGLEWNDFRLT